MTNYVKSVGMEYYPEREESTMGSLFREYERVIVESLVTSFGLDFIVRDQHGGDVDTIHNVRQIGSDPLMQYKNAENQRAYENRGEYSSSEYHGDRRYIEINQQVKHKKEQGKLKDAYTGERFHQNDRTDLDHVIAANKIHNDKGRVLAGLSGTDLANNEDNLKATNPHTNRSKKADTMEEFLEKHGDEYTEDQKKRMRAVDAKARKAYEAKLARAYYTSPKFAKDVAVAAGKESLSMGLRQALGLVFTEIWFAVKEEFQAASREGSFDVSVFFSSLGNGIKYGFQRAKEKYKDVFERFIDGAVSGALSSIVTTLTNIFFTTAKNTVRIIRQAFASLVQAAKVLFLNPDNYSFGERMRAVAKILATAASVITGILVSEAINDSPIGKIPVIGDIVQTFCGTFVTGIMSCTLLFVLDHNEIINKIVRALDFGMDNAVDYYRRQADMMEAYAAELMKIDLAKFRKEVSMYKNIAVNIENASTETELNHVLKEAYASINAEIQWKGYDSFDSFMKDKKATLVFE